MGILKNLVVEEVGCNVVPGEWKTDYQLVLPGIKRAIGTRKIRTNKRTRIGVAIHANKNSQKKYVNELLSQARRPDENYAQWQKRMNGIKLKKPKVNFGPKYKNSPVYDTPICEPPVNLEHDQVYAKYVKTSHWCVRRDAFLMTHGECVACHSKKDPQVHHILRKRNDRSTLFNERDSDLCRLCTKCYTILYTHGLTKLFIDDERECKRRILKWRRILE